MHPTPLTELGVEDKKGLTTEALRFLAILRTASEVQSQALFEPKKELRMPQQALANG